MTRSDARCLRCSRGMMTRRVLPAARPEDDFRGLAPRYVRELGDEAFVIGSFLMFGGGGLLVAPALWRPWGWALAAAGVLLVWLAVRAMKFALRAWEEASGKAFREQ